MIEGPSFYMLRHQLDPKLRHLLPTPQHQQCLYLLGDLTCHFGALPTCKKRCMSLGPTQVQILPPSSPTLNRNAKLRQLLYWTKPMGQEVKSIRHRKWGDASLTTFASEKPEVEGQWDSRGYGFA